MKVTSAEQQRRYKKHLSESVDFHRLMSGDADKATVDRCFATLDNYINNMPIMAGASYSEYTVFVAGARGILEHIKSRAEKGKGVADDNDN